MTASELLAQYNITVDQARSWIMEHVNQPELIYNTARQYGLNNEMLAEIVEPVVSGASEAQIESYFNSHGLDGSALSSGSSEGDNSAGTSFMALPESYSGLLNLVGLNEREGVLSTDSIRATALTMVSESAYYSLFDPANYADASDGILSVSETGNAVLGELEATTENLESLYYGTFLNFFTAIDQEEMVELQSFALNNQAALSAGNTAVVQEYFDLIVATFEDPAVNPLYTDNELATGLASITAVTAMTYSGQPATGLFDGLLLT